MEKEIKDLKEKCDARKQELEEMTTKVEEVMTSPSLVYLFTSLLNALSQQKLMYIFVAVLANSQST